MTDVIRLDTKRLDAIVKELNASTEKVMRDFAFALQGQIIIQSPPVPYDTGAMVNSICTRTRDRDGYPAAEAAARAHNPNVDISPFPAPSGRIVATVGVGVNYAIYVELGTSRMGARPFFVPVFERMSKAWNDGKTWKEIVNP